MTRAKDLDIWIAQSLADAPIKGEAVIISALDINAALEMLKKQKKEKGKKDNKDPWPEADYIIPEEMDEEEKEADTDALPQIRS